MILCVGTTPVMQRTMVFPRVQIDAVNRAVAVHETASGKSINVARVAHTLDEEVMATGYLGGDSGKFIRADLSAAGVPHDFVEVEPKTRMCVTVMDESSGHATELVEEAQPVGAEAWEALKRKVESLAKREKLLVLSGSLPPGGPVDFYAWCVGLGVKTIVDAAGAPLRRALEARPFLVKPNRMELERTFGPGASLDRAEWAVITEGKSGGVVSNGKMSWRFQSPAVRAINAIGSGDSVAAGIAVALVRGEKMPDAVKLGIACGAANAMTKTAGVVNLADVNALLSRVEINRS